MRKLNNANKFFILLFSLIIVGIICLLVYSMSMGGKFDNLTAIYQLSTNSVVYNYDDVLLDTKTGGELKKSWDSMYYFIDVEGNSSEVGDRVVIYDKAKETITLFGDSYFVSEGGNVVKNGVEKAKALCFPDDLIQILSEYNGEENMPSTPESALIHIIDGLLIKLELLDKEVGTSQWNREVLIYQTLNEFSTAGLYDHSGLSINAFIKIREWLAKEELL